MNPGTQALIAAIPIIVTAILLVGLRWSAVRAMPLIIDLSKVRVHFLCRS